MFLKEQNREILRRLEDGDPDLTIVHFAAPFNWNVPYKAVDDFNHFLQCLLRRHYISTLKLSDLWLNLEQILMLARGIHSSTTLKKLVLYKLYRENGGFWYLANAIKHSASLNEIVLDSVRMRLCHYRILTNAIQANSNVQSLTIKSCRKIKMALPIIGEYLMGSSSLTALRLKRAKLDDTSLSHLLSCINKNNTVKRLELDYNKVKLEDSHLVALLIENKSITYLNLYGNEINQNGLNSLIDVLSANSQINRIKLYEWGYNGIYKQFLGKLKCIRTLKHLSWGNQTFDKKEMSLLGEVFLNNSTLTRLNLGRPIIQRMLAEGLIEAISTSLYLTRLNISSIVIENDQLIIFSNWLQTNETLVHLTMRNNHITSLSIEILCKALIKNCTLNYLDLGDNLVSPSGAEKLSNSLICNKSLIQLKLANNYIGTQGLRYISNALLLRPPMLKLNIRNNAFGSDGIQYVERLLIKFPKLRVTAYDWHLIGEAGITSLNTIIANSPGIDHVKYKIYQGKKKIFCFENESILALSEALSGDYSIKKFSLYSGILNLGDYTLLLNSLRNLKNLSILELAKSIDKKTVPPLFNWLITNKTLQTLNLQNNWCIGNFSFLISEFIKNNSSLTDLNLSDCLLNESFLIVIFESLKLNFSLKKLNINNYSEPSEPYAFIGKSLSINNTLTHLKIIPRFEWHFKHDLSFLNVGLKAKKNCSLVFCNYSKHDETLLPSLLINRQNKMCVLLLLKEYVSIKVLARGKIAVHDAHILFSLFKDLFLLILRHVYPAFNTADISYYYQLFEISCTKLKAAKPFNNNFYSSQYSINFFKNRVIDNQNVSVIEPHNNKPTIRLLTM